MHVTRISLTNFRNYGRLELKLPTGSTLLHGSNAQGKTNLLEAIYYLATTKSPQVDQDQQLINWDALDPEEPIIAGIISAELKTNDGRKVVEMRLIKERQRGQDNFRRQALVDKRKVRLMDLLGNLRVVLFLPQDVQIITGSPAQRRRYLDITLCQTDREYCRALSAYNKVLEQRNALLRNIAERGDGLDVLPIYTDELVKLGSQILTRRANFVAALAREAQNIHFERLTDGQETLRLSYLPRLLAFNTHRGDDATLNEVIELGHWLEGQPDLDAVADRFSKALVEAQAADIASGTTRIGPHRDDWRFWVAGRNLKTYGSRGQQRTALLALKLAEISWMGEETGESPILLLDEVVAELDGNRRALLLETVESVTQSILTATDPKMFTSTFLESANILHVEAGQIRPERKKLIQS